MSDGETGQNPAKAYTRDIMTKTKSRKTSRSRVSKKKPIGIHHQVAHHVKRAFFATPKFVHGMVVGAFVGVMVVAFLGSNGLAHADSSPAASAEDCTDISVIYCGAQTVSDLISKYNNGDNDPYGNASKVYIIHDIYNWFGITPTDVNNMGSGNATTSGSTVSGSGTLTGYVDIDGDVYTGTPGGSHILVATNALTGGRTNPYGDLSTPEFYGHTHFFVRPPHVSFENENLKAFVVVKDGVFQFAILVSCSNPIKATPVQPPKPPTPTPTPTPAPAPKPSLTCNQLNVTPGTVDKSSGDQNYTLVAQALVMNGAVVKSYTFNYGDSTPNRVVDTSALSTTVTHTYTPGTYRTTVTVNGSSSLSSSCAWTVTINKPGTPPVVTQIIPTATTTATPTGVTSLPNTGPGAVIIIAIASVVGGYAFHMTHRHIRSKRRAHHHTTHHGPSHHRPAHA